MGIDINPIPVGKRLCLVISDLLNLFIFVKMVIGDDIEASFNPWVNTLPALLLNICKIKHPFIKSHLFGLYFPLSVFVLKLNSKLESFFGLLCFGIYNCKLGR